MPLDAGFWSAIFGAIVGGLLALIAQCIQIYYIEKTRKLDEKERRILLAHSLMFKIIKIYTNIRLMKNHIEGDMKNFSQIDVLKEHVYVQVRPVVTRLSEVNFTPEELTLAMRLKDDEFFNRIASIDAIHNSHLQTLQHMSSTIIDIRNNIGFIFDKNGNVTNISGLESDKIMPKATELSELIPSFLSELRADEILTASSIESLNSKLKKILGISTSFNLRNHENK